MAGRGCSNTQGQPPRRRYPASIWPYETLIGAEGIQEGPVTEIGSSHLPYAKITYLGDIHWTSAKNNTNLLLPSLVGPSHHVEIRSGTHLETLQETQILTRRMTQRKRFVRETQGGLTHPAVTRPGQTGPNWSGDVETVFHDPDTSRMRCTRARFDVCHRWRTRCDPMDDPRWGSIKNGITSEPNSNVNLWNMS